MQQSKASTTAAQTVRIRGQEQSYIARRRIGRGDYFLLERVGSPWRERYRAFDPQAGPGGDFFLVQLLADERRTQQQLRVLRRLKDDSFPRVWHWQRQQNQVAIVSSWIAGISLAEYFEHLRAGRRPPVDPGHAVRLIYGLARGAGLLQHKLQIAHGDIQPANVVITSHPSRLVLIDYGSAWTVQTSAWNEEGDGHHRIYAAPELQLGRLVNGFLADQFSVSVIFYQLLTGQLPYGGLGGKAGRPEYAAANVLALPSTVSAACGALPGSLREGIDRLVSRGLALDPLLRYADRHVWQDDLFAVSAGFRLQPKSPPALGWLTRVVRWLVVPRVRG